DCISYGEKHRKSSPAWAKRAFEAVLALDPKNEKAVAAVKELIDVQRAGGGFGLPEFLIKRDSMSGWDGAEYSSRWTCKGRTITGDQRSPGIICYRSGVFLRKTYRLTVRARVVERYSADWYWGLMFGTDANAPKMYSFGYGYQQDVYLVRNAGTNMKDLWSKPKTHWDPKEWHILRVDVTPDKVTCYADGEEVFSHGAELARDFEGTMGLNIRGARVEFTDLKVYR
ncbi:MAG: family 16 glycoside hydrolase, partial [Planctomycetota bacterium]